MTYLTEKRVNFTGGYNTAYLMHSADKGLTIHTIARLDGGCYLQREPQAVGPVKDLERALERAAEFV